MFRGVTVQEDHGHPVGERMRGEYERGSSVKMAESVIQLPFIEQFFNSFANFSDVFLDCS